MEARMTESDKKPATFLGTYFDRDGVIRLSRWADILAWVVLTLYLLSWVFQIVLFLSQYYNGMLGDKGATLLTVYNIFSPYLLQPIPGVLYFFALQAISKILLILLDVEDNTRRGARQ
jgi:hypothetical protein